MIASMLVIPVLGKRFIKSHIVAISAAAISLVLSIYYLFADFGSSLTESYKWFNVSGLFTLSLTGNNVTLLAAAVVSFISLMVLVFSVFYMRKEPQERYYMEMSLFIASMLGLVLSGSLLLFYVFWELVGVSSYLLIGFWYKKEKAAAAGKKALVMTRIGDMALLAAIVILFSAFKTFSIPAIIQLISTAPPVVVFLAGSLVFIAALSKSAQFPFYTWLPDAMEGPTPVSALLHSATMVAAGAYLLIILYPLISAAGLGAAIISIGLFTAFVSSLLALNHRHFKRILAYSTIESLAFMFIAIGTLNTGGALFYLITHAFFKSMLFFVSGVFAVLLGVQDVYALKAKKLSSTWLKIPALVGFASIAGLPPFMSFFAHMALSVNFSLLENSLFTVIAFLTSLFAFRAFFLVFNGSSSAKLTRSAASSLPIYTLTAIAIMGGVFVFFFRSIISSFAYTADTFTIITTAAAFAGVYISFLVFYKEKYGRLSLSFKKTANKLADIGYDKLLFKFGMSFVAAGEAIGKLDALLSSFYNSVADAALSFSSKLRKTETGDVETYITAILIGLIAIIAVASVLV